MKIFDKLVLSGRFDWPWWSWFCQGAVIMLLGLNLAFASVFNMNVTILSAFEFSWLPVCGMIILVLGIFECIDGLFAKEICDYMQRMNAGVLDSVFGLLLVFGVSDTPDRLGLMISLYLLVRSILRAVYAVVLKIPHLYLTLMLCLSSSILGIMIWTQWPTQESWFLALSLSIEIFFRGLIMMFFAFFIKNHSSLN